SNRQTRLEWIGALDRIDALKPSAVVAGHKIPGNDDSPKNVEETRQYIRDFIRLNDATKTARELYDQMLSFTLIVPILVPFGVPPLLPRLRHDAAHRNNSARVISIACLFGTRSIALLLVDGQAVVLPVYSTGQRSQRWPISQNIHS
ncbi:MAG: hypothetical protein QOK44_755, partial [Betaproteobacteria bacterium]|nr:hypothetical protein [Betaproteobacteria bacterium]